MAKLLGDASLLADARHAADLFTDDLIAADRQLDVVGGAAGGILALLRLFRDTGDGDVLARATACGEHLLRRPRSGVPGRRSWSGLGSPPEVNGMSHGAAGFAYAMASLAEASGRDAFREAAVECIAFENATFDPQRKNWPDLRGAEDPSWRCQWCHGAPGIGLARIGTRRRHRPDPGLLADISEALAGVEQSWPGPVDTLCCGTLGNIEFLSEAAGALARPDLREVASRRLMTVLRTARAAGDYRWNTGSRRFNLGLFRGISGVGYTCLRRAVPAFPDILIWE
jgi:lantibiotic modifying enzyme